MSQDADRARAANLAPGRGLLRSGRRAWLWWLIPIGACWLWYWLLSAVALERIQALGVVGSYSFAVYNQLFWNFAWTGSFEQTIHVSYVDNWIWSGHRSPWIFVVGWLYHLAPEPITLCRIQIGAVALGGLPAFGLGWRVFGGPLGGIAGLLMYLGYPPVAILALSDYQDMILGIPLAVAVVHQAWRGSPRGFALACLATAASREEWILVVPCLGLLAPGAWRERLVWVARALAVALVYFMVLWWVSFDPTAHGRAAGSHPRPSLPASWHEGVERVHGVLAPVPYANVDPVQETWQRTWMGFLKITRTRDELRNFYLDLLAPVHLGAVFSPWAILPAAGALAVHLTAPQDIGIDANWGRVIHHVGPIAVLLVLGTILGIGWCYRRTRGSRWLWIPLGLLGLFLVMAVGKNWASQLRVPWLGSHGVRMPAPEWELVAQVPPEASIATDQQAALLICNRRLCYTYDDSLREKAPGRSPKGLDYILISKEHPDWMEWARRLEGNRLLGETPRYLLYWLPWADPSAPPRPAPSGSP